MTSREKDAVAAALGEVPLQGNPFHAEQLRKLVLVHGKAATPFLVRALEAGSAPIKAAAMQALGRVDPVAATEPALAFMGSAREDPEVRASAAEVLAHVPTERALPVLLQAIYDSPLVADAALGALEEHARTFATRSVHQELRRLVNEIAAPGFDAQTNADQGRRLRAMQGLVSLVARRSFQEVEAELLAWWRTHPNTQVQYWSADALLSGGVQHACAVLSEGIPGTNEGRPTGTGELDGPARMLIPKAAMVVLRGPAPEAFELLAPYCRTAAVAGWFGNKRAEVILLLLLGQVGYNPTSWLWGWADELGRSGVLPDQRWRGVASQLPQSSLSLRMLAEQLSATLSPRQP
jgi:hypothetical protein